MVIRGTRAGAAVLLAAALSACSSPTSEPRRGAYPQPRCHDRDCPGHRRAAAPADPVTRTAWSAASTSRTSRDATDLARARRVAGRNSRRAGTTVCGGGIRDPGPRLHPRRGPPPDPRHGAAGVLRRRARWLREHPDSSGEAPRCGASLGRRGVAAARGDVPRPCPGSSRGYPPTRPLWPALLDSAGHYSPLLRQWCPPNERDSDPSRPGTGPGPTRLRRGGRDLGLLWDVTSSCRRTRTRHVSTTPV